MSDTYISRKAAIEALEGVDWFHEVDGELYPGGTSDMNTYVPYKAVEEALNSIPAADVRPVKKGEWIDHQEGRWIYAKCSECGTVHDVKSNFCPNCGAKMEAGKLATQQKDTLAFIGETAACVPSSRLTPFIAAA